MRWTKEDRQIARELIDSGSSVRDVASAFRIAEYISQIRESLYPPLTTLIKFMSDPQLRGAAAALRTRTTTTTKVEEKDGHIVSILTEEVSTFNYDVYVYGLHQNVLKSVRSLGDEGLVISPRQMLFSYAFHEVRHEMQDKKHTKIFVPGMKDHPEPLVTTALRFVNNMWEWLELFIKEDPTVTEVYLLNEFDSWTIQVCSMLAYKDFPTSQTEIDEIMWLQAT
jgi:hypothetical protein